MTKTLALVLFCLVCAQAEPLQVAHGTTDVRGRKAKPLFLKSLFKKAKDLVVKHAPSIISKVLPGPIGNLVSNAIPVLTGGGSLGSKLMNIGQQVLGSGLLPPKISNIANTAMNAFQGFQNGGIGGAVNALTNGQGIGSLLPGGSSGPIGSIVNQFAGNLLNGGGSGSVGGGSVGGGAQGGGSGIQAGGLGQGQGQQTGGTGSAQNNHQQVLNQGQAGGLAAAPTPVPPPNPTPVPAHKPLPQVTGKSSGTGRDSSPGNPAVWTGHAVDPMLAMAGTKVSGIKGGSGDATNGFTMKGRYGNLKMQADGNWEYDLDESSPLVKAYGDRPNALFDVFALEFTGMAPAEKEIRIHVWEHFKKNP